MLSIFLVTKDLTKRGDMEIKKQGNFALQITKNFLTRLRSSYMVKLNFLANEDREFINKLLNEENPSELLKQNSTKYGFSSIELIDPSGKNMFGESSLRNFPIEIEKCAHDGEMATKLILKSDNISLAVAVPVIGGGTERGTVLRGVVYFNNDFLDTVKDITDMEVSLFTIEGNKRIVTTMMGTNARRYTEGNIASWIREELKSKTLTTNNEIFMGKKFLVVYSCLKDDFGKQGYISIAIPEETFKKTSSIIVKYLYGVGAISLILAIVAGYLLSNSIATPLKNFASLANLISEGNFEEKVNIDRNDEIGELASTFNHMTDKLKETMNRLERRMFEISTLYSVSQSMNFMNNSEQLLNMILDKAVKALKADRGSLMLVNPETYELEVSVISGFKGKMKKRVSIKMGEGLAGIAFETGVSQVSQNIAEDQRFKDFKSAPNNVRQMLCVPLKTKDRVSGVINISNKLDNTDFSENDIHLLEALATQAAVTIENAKLYELSITDGMTKLFIHRYFQIRLDEELKRASRYGHEVSLIMTDIDHFKNFNDTYGHQTGDVVIIRYAQLMKDAIRLDVDIPCRYGGEEFITIAPNTGKEEAMIMAERLRKMVETEEMPGPDGEILKVTISIGIATYPSNSTEKQELIKKADTALYHSKENGRNQSTHYSDI